MPTYNKTTWVNKQTKLNATNMNKIEDGIEANAEAINTNTTALEGKQDTLTAGDNITISGNVISATSSGGTTVVANPGSGTTDLTTITIGDTNYNVGSGGTSPLSDYTLIELSSLSITEEQATTIRNNSNNIIIKYNNKLYFYSYFDGYREPLSVNCYSYSYICLTNTGTLEYLDYYIDNYYASMLIIILKYDADTGSDVFSSSSVSLQSLTLQPKLVSGTSIKTINSTSLLGSGNISIPVVSANPTTTGTTDLTSIGIGGTTYNIPSGSSSGAEITKGRVAANENALNLTFGTDVVAGSILIFYSDSDTGINFNYSQTLGGQIFTTTPKYLYYIYFVNAGNNSYEIVVYSPNNTSFATYSGNSNALYIGYGQTFDEAYFYYQIIK